MSTYSLNKAQLKALNFKLLLDVSTIHVAFVLICTQKVGITVIRQPKDITYLLFTLRQAR